MRDEFIRLDTAIIPTPDVTQKAILLSRKFAKEKKTYFVLGKRQSIPHITCYSVEYPVKNLKRIFASLLSLAKTSNSFDIEIPGLLLDDSEGVLGVEMSVKKTKLLDEFHRNIIKVLNPLREGHLREKYKNPEYINKFPGDKRKLMSEIMQNVGYARVLDMYNPHISVAAFSETMNKEDVTLPIFEPIKMSVKRIGVYEMGEWGTCSKLLKSFSLKD